MRINISMPASLVKGDCCISISPESPSIDISVPTALLKETKVNVDIGMGIEVPVSLDVEDDWLVIKAPTSTIRYCPQVQDGKLAFDDLKVSGSLWLARSKIIKSLEDSTKNIILHDISLRSSDMHISFSPRTS
jgi:hypothetical protein